MSNLYFVVVAIVIQIPGISPVLPIAGIIPIIFILTVALIKEGLEDLVLLYLFVDSASRFPNTFLQARHREDDVHNSKLYEVLQNDGTTVNVKSRGKSNFSSVSASRILQKSIKLFILLNVKAFS